MAEASKSSPSFPASPGADQLPDVCLEVHHGSSRSTLYVVPEAGFIIGTVPGCDLRLAGTTSSAVLCLIGRGPGGANIRRLSTGQAIQVNGQPVATSALAHGDHIQIGPVEIVVQLQAPSKAPIKILQGSAASAKPQSNTAPAAVEAARQKLEQQISQFREKVVRFEQDKQTLETEIDRQRQELAQRSAELDQRHKDLYADRQTLQTQQTAAAERQKTDQLPQGRLAEREQALAKQEEEAAAQKQELAKLRQELADIRTELYDRYRERRDRMAALQESVNKAARKVQERKQQLEAEVRELENRRQADAARQADLETHVTDLTQARQLFDEERRLHEARVAQLNEEVKRRSDECQAREDKLVADRAALIEEQERHKQDLLAFARSQAELDQRRQQLADRERDSEQRLEQLRTDTADLENQVVQLDEWHTKLSAVGEKLAKQKTEQEHVSQQLAQRAAALEGQQAALAALRTRLERMREATQQEEQHLAEQRAKQETAEAELRQKLEEADRIRQELDGDKTLMEQERRVVNERSATLESAVVQLRQAQERLAADQQRVQEQSQALEAATAQQAEAASLLQARIAQHDDLQQRVESERENLRERSLLLVQAEQARETLQEQLRRRSEELAARQKTLQEQAAKNEADVAALQKQHEEFEGFHKLHGQELAAQQHSLEQRAVELDAQKTALDARAAEINRDQAKLEEANRTLTDQSEELVEQRVKLDADRRAAEAAAQQAAADLEAGRREVQVLQQRLPELELRAGTALERLTHGREQMREHLDQVHTYAAQCREELETLRAQVQAEAERLQQQEQSLRRGQDEQRLAVAAFRQQLIDWQGQIADMKRLMVHDETRLEQRQVQVAEQARQLGADTARLAQQAEQLQEKEREVAEQRAEIDRHLGDMREWYRAKLRELAGISDHDEDADAPAEDGPRRDILSLTGDIDPIDRKLGDLMRSLELIEPDTLTALFIEARRQRRSLRQVLLANGTVTLYQMALIEAGNLDGLMLGPVRVVDRLRATPRETFYRVFDPRRGSEAVLRLLAETEAHDAAHADDFRLRFTRAMVAHPNIGATLEVLDIAGRPAVLQEWLTGLPSTDWPALAGAPGAWYRLMLQAAQALGAAHEAGLFHGHLEPSHFVLTPEGILKLCGFGEPAWLTGTESGENASADLITLAGIAAGWCVAPQQKTVRGRPLPANLQYVVDHLTTQGEKQIATAAMLLSELEKAGASLPANAEAWDRLLRHVKAHAGPLAAVRQSA